MRDDPTDCPGASSLGPTCANSHRSCYKPERPLIGRASPRFRCKVRLIAHKCCTAPARALQKQAGAKEAAMGEEHKHSRIEVTSTCTSCGEQLGRGRSEEHTSELQSHSDLVCRL